MRRAHGKTAVDPVVWFFRMRSDGRKFAEIEHSAAALLAGITKNAVFPKELASGGTEMTLKNVTIAAALAVLSGCAGGEFDLELDTLFSSKSPPAAQQAMRWDHVPESETWTEATLAALDSHGQNLVNTLPTDIAAWCPGYAKSDVEGRKAFWTGLLSTLAKHESTWQPTVVGGGGRWFGLVQISPATARHYGCRAGSGEALKDGASNLSCAVRILDTTVPRDGVVSAGMRGVAADWGPFHQQSKREDMRAWMLSQPYCKG